MTWTEGLEGAVAFWRGKRPLETFSEADHELVWFEGRMVALRQHHWAKGQFSQPNVYDGIDTVTLQPVRFEAEDLRPVTNVELLDQDLARRLTSLPEGYAEHMANLVRRAAESFPVLGGQTYGPWSVRAQRNGRLFEVELGDGQRTWSFSVEAEDHLRLEDIFRHIAHDVSNVSGPDGHGRHVSFKEPVQECSAIARRVLGADFDALPESWRLWGHVEHYHGGRRMQWPLHHAVEHGLVARLGEPLIHGLLEALEAVVHRSWVEQVGAHLRKAEADIDAGVPAGVGAARQVAQDLYHRAVELHGETAALDVAHLVREASRIATKAAPSLLEVQCKKMRAGLDRLRGRIALKEGFHEELPWLLLSLETESAPPERRGGRPRCAAADPPGHEHGQPAESP